MQTHRNVIANLQNMLVRSVVAGIVEKHRDVGVVLDLMIHDVDLVLSLVRSPVRSVRSKAKPGGVSRRAP